MKSFKNKVKGKVFTALGEASICWSTLPKGCFDSSRVFKIGEELIEFMEKEKISAVRKFIKRQERKINLMEQSI